MPRAPRVSDRRIATAAALLAEAAGIVWLTWPLAARMTTDIPATNLVYASDSLHQAWILVHATRALVGSAPLLDTNAFHPAHGTLFYNQVGFGALPLFAPPFLVTGNPVLAFDVLFLGGILVTTWAIHAVVQRWTGSASAGLVASAAFLMTPWVLWHSMPSAPHHTMLAYVPLIVLATANGPSRARQVLALAALLALQGLVELLYVAPMVFLVVGVVALARLRRHSTRALGRRTLAAIAVALGLLAPLYVGYLSVLREPGIFTRTFMSAELMSRMEEEVLLWIGHIPSPLDLPFPAFVLIGAGLVALAVRRWWGDATAHGDATARDLAWRHVGLWSALGVVVTFPMRMAYGQHVVTLPHWRMVQALGLERLVGQPYRHAEPTMIALAMLAGIAFAEIAERLPRRGARAILALLVLAACHAAYARGDTVWQMRWDPIRNGPYRTAPPPASQTSPLAVALRASDGPILELPVTGFPARDRQAEALYRSIFHGRPVLNGDASFYPPGFDYRMTLAERLPDPTALALLVGLSGLRTIVVHGRGFSHALAPGSPWLAFLHRQRRRDLRLVGRIEDALVFDVVPRGVPASSPPVTTP